MSPKFHGYNDGEQLKVFDVELLLSNEIWEIAMKLILNKSNTSSDQTCVRGA